MAEEVRSVEQFKAERTSAKRLFTRLANSIVRDHAEMSEEDLRESHKKISQLATRVLEANEDVEAAVCDAESAEEEEQAAQHRADITKTVDECEKRLKEIKDIIQKTLWDKYGEEKLSMALQVAELACEEVAEIKHSADLEAYDFKLIHLESLIKAAKEADELWRFWAPSAEQAVFKNHLRELTFQLPKLVSRKALFIQAKTNEDAKAQPQPVMLSSCPAPPIKLKPTALPKFTGVRRDYYCWKKEWEALQRQGEPTGSREVKKLQLLGSIDEKITQGLHLSTYRSADEIFRVLQNRYGNKPCIVLEIIEELQALPPVRGLQPRKIVQLIQAVEKAMYDLAVLGEVGALKNPVTMKCIESKLPDTLKKDWLTYAAGQIDVEDPHKRFDALLYFLKEQEAIFEQLGQLQEEESNKRESRPDPRYARTKATKIGEQGGCIVCGDHKHKRKLYFCNKFKTLPLSKRLDAVERLDACNQCLEIHDSSQYCKPAFLCKNYDCDDQDISSHHYLLCPNTQARSQPQRTGLGSVGGGFTEAQEEFLSKLSPELARQCKLAFSNTASRASSRTYNSVGQSQLLRESGLKEFPVIMMLLNATTNAGQKIGTMIDLASDTNYITHDAAKDLNLKNEPVTLVVNGVGGMRTTVETKRYLLKLKVKTPEGTLRAHQLVCYGLDHIADVHQHVSAKRLQRLFPDIPLHDLERPKEIQLLVSHKEGQLAPQKVRSVEDLVLWDSPLGKAVGGTHPHLFEKISLIAHSSKTHFARSMKASSVKYTDLTCSLPCQVPVAPAVQVTCECGPCLCCKSGQPEARECVSGHEKLSIVRCGKAVCSRDHCEDPHRPTINSKVIQKKAAEEETWGYRRPVEPLKDHSGRGDPGAQPAKHKGMIPGWLTDLKLSCSSVVTPSARDGIAKRGCTKGVRKKKCKGRSDTCLSFESPAKWSEVNQNSKETSTCLKDRYTPVQSSPRFWSRSKVYPMSNTMLRSDNPPTQSRRRQVAVDLRDLPERTRKLEWEVFRRAAISHASQ